MVYGKTLEGVVEEAKRILEVSRERCIVLRLIGGLAIRLHCPSATHRSLRRSYPDIDWMGLWKQDEQIKRMFEDLGYVPNKIYNALHPGRLQFGDFEHERLIDVMLDKFKMCHTVDLRKRLEIDEFTIPLADLLLTKMQIVKLNEKDVRDVIALLKDHELGETDCLETVNIDYISKMCSKDWGWYKTLTINLEQVLMLLPSYKLEKCDEDEVKNKINIILERIKDEPKSLVWKVRSIIGERKQWWYPVEEVIR